MLRILAANPILEAFGNAKTVLNNNSSRFGKFTKLLFDDDSKNGVHIVGSAIETFLLEKSRVVFQTKGERNYHIFYQLMAGADSKTKATLGIDSGPRGFHYTSQSGCDTVQGIPDASRYKELISSLELAGFSSEDIEGIQQLIAFILHLSNVRFTIDDKDVCHVDAKTQASLETAARLGGVTVEALTKCLCYRSLKISGKVIFKPYNAETSVVNRDSMAKSLFNCCFDFVVKTINKVMFVGDKSDKLMWIGILDVFGFECFAYNSFEQLCINLANERLQQFFNVHVIKSEQEEYEREAIYWSPVKVPDNQACLDMILKKTTGVLALLDTACATPKADDTVFTSIVFKEYKNHPSIKQVRTLPGTKGRSKVRINGFQVSHYARDVCYDAREFLKKNQDAPPTDMINLFRESESELFFKVMVGEDRASATSPVAKKKKGRAKRKTLSVGGNFAKQLRNLMKNLKTTRPFFIRCVKPNLAKKPNMWVDYMITNQLEAGGLIQALKIIKCGYPTRVDYKTIYTGYKKVLTNPPADLNERDFVEALMIANKFSRSQFVLGLTKVFFKSDQQDFVTQLLNPQNALSPEVVKGIERHLIRKKIIRTMAVVRAYARWQVLSMQKKQREAAFTLQAALQAYAAKRNLRNLRQANLSAFSAGQKSLAALAAGRRDEVSAVATQVAKWISAVSGLPVNEGMSFFDEAASANKLCMLLVVLGYPVTPHANVSPASSGARDNVSDFISGCKGLGVGSAQLMKLDDLFLLKRPLVALNMILNLCLSTQKRMDALPTVAFECSERKRKGQNLSKGICFYGEGKGILENMTDERRQELFQPGYIQRKRDQENAKRKAAEDAKKKVCFLHRSLILSKCFFSFSGVLLGDLLGVCY